MNLRTCNRLRVAMACLPAIGAVLLVSLLLRRAGLPTYSNANPNNLHSPKRLLGRIDRGDAAAMALAVNECRRDWGAWQPVVAEMLGSDTHQRRAVACRMLAEHSGSESVALLVPRTSDAEGVVRTAAFGALARLGPAPDPLPLRDTPMDLRERWMLTWLASYDKKSGTDLTNQLCELYANDRHVEYGRPVTGRCLTCHAGAAPAGFDHNDACKDCHAGTYSEWARSAHAQSLVHLQLPTVNPTSRQVERVDFGAVRGIGCTECHRLAGGQQARGAVTTQAAGSACPYAFDPALPARESCGRCHEGTYRQWQAWRAGYQPERVAWPPGQIEVAAAEESRSCADCHMKPARDSKPDMQTTADAGPSTRHEHQWAARRDVLFLQEGIDVRAEVVRSETGERQGRFVLTNLAGHAYPTGTWRRAVYLYVGSEDEERLVAGLRPGRPYMRAADTQPALGMGEQRVLSVPLSGLDAEEYRLRYFRNRDVQGSYTTVILRGTMDPG